MKTLMHCLRRLAAATTLLAACAVPASANPISGATVDFTNGQGTLTGFFQLDTTTGSVTNWDLAVTAFNCADPASCVFSGFPATDYTPANSTTSTSFSFGNQGIFFIAQVFGSSSVLSFVMDCGGNNNDCIHTAILGSAIPLLTAGESRAIVPIGRSLSLASLSVTDPPSVLSFNVISPSAAPEPATLTLLGIGLAGLLSFSRRARKQ